MRKLFLLIKYILLEIKFRKFRYPIKKKIWNNVKYALHLILIKNHVMNYLLPHRFKKIGAFLAPVGFTLWICMQLGIITHALNLFFGESENNHAIFHLVNVCIAILSFFSFLAGMYFITFSKEKIEDEMVQRTRLDSFQFAALLQIIFIIIGFVSMLIFEEPSEGGLMLFFISLLFLFWVSFIFRFNYILHIKIIRSNH